MKYNQNESNEFDVQTKKKFINTKVFEFGDFSDFDVMHVSKQEQRDKLIDGSVSGYTMVPHELFRSIMPSLLKKYNKPKEAEKVRSAIILLQYLHSMTYGGGKEGYDSRLYGWAFPTDVQIMKDTGIGESQLKNRKDFLEAEKLLKIRKVKNKNGRPKDYYLPFYYPFENSQ